MTGFEFKHVSFAYPGTDKKVLEDVSFVIEAGKRYSLLGINGSGKTTITKLITRLYSNFEGEILINDIPISQWRLADIKAMFSAVFQDFIEYDISLYDNISAGNGLNSTREEVEAAIKSAGLDEFASSLNEGADTLLGKIYDDGVLPSGGQWQRIAIARAVVSHAQLKILDEPTASLDPIAEREVYERFERNQQKRGDNIHQPPARVGAQLGRDTDTRQRPHRREGNSRRAHGAEWDLRQYV